MECSIREFADDLYLINHALRIAVSKHLASILIKVDRNLQHDLIPLVELRLHYESLIARTSINSDNMRVIVSENLGEFSGGGNLSEALPQDIAIPFCRKQIIGPPRSLCGSTRPGGRLALPTAASEEEDDQWNDTCASQIF
jgi:hypothetical protein